MKTKSYLLSGWFNYRPTKLTWLFVLAAFLPGCCTPALWKKKDYHPSEHVNLHLFWSGEYGDILARYDEQCGTNGTVKTRSYWLFAYAMADTNAIARSKPDFVEVTNHELISISILTNPPTAKDFSANNWLAEASPDQCSFTLWLNSTNQGDYTLPVYRAATCNRAGQIILTPLAIVGDTALVGAAVGVSAMAHGALPVK